MSTTTSSRRLASQGVTDARERELPRWSPDDALDFMERHDIQTYESRAVVGNGTPVPALPDDIRMYVPTSRPGAPLPHAELEDLDGGRLPMMSLVRPGEFLVIAGEDGHAWCAAAREIAETTCIPVRAVRIGHLDGDYRDPRCTWLRQRQIGSRGAVLVRPDRFVGWRSIEEPANPLYELGTALARFYVEK